MKKLLLLMSLFTILMFASVSAATIPVIPGDSIQSAINSAASGDVITIANGLYSGALTINKPLTLLGESTAGVTIDTSAASGYSIYVTSSDVNLEGFTLIGNGGSASYGIKVSPSGASDISSITIEDVIVHDTFRSGIDFNGVDKISLDNVEVFDVTYGVGVAFTDSTQIVANNIRTYDNAWAGMALYASGTYYPPALVDDILLTNTDLGELVPLYSESSGTVSNVDASEFLCVVTNDLAPTYTWYFYDTDGVSTFLGKQDFPETFDVKCSEPSDVPEFGAVAALAVLGLAGLFIYRKRK